MVRIDQDLAKVLIYFNYDIESDEFKIVCPFHKDINPSLSISLSKGVFYCHGCNLKGGAKEFVKHFYEIQKGEKLSPMELQKRYRKILNSDKVSDFNPSDIKRRPRKSDRQKIIESKDYYYNLRKTDWREERDSDEYQYLKNRGVRANTLNELKAKINDSVNYPIVFPVLDNGKFKGYVCRTMDKEIEAKRKYLYNEGFSRATMLCGNYDNESPLIIVEGYFDRIPFLQAGYKNVAAIFGWKLTMEQRDLLRLAGVEEIISALDNDKSGRKGTRVLRDTFDNVKRFPFPKGIKDPGEMSRKQIKASMNKIL